MTKDLAVCVHGEKVTPDQYLNTEAFLDIIDGNLRRAWVVNLPTKTIFHSEKLWLQFY